MPDPGEQAQRNGRPVTVVLVALVLAACAFAYAIGIAWADDGGSNAASSSQSAPTTQPVQQNTDRPRHDCPEKDGSGGSGGSDSEGSSGSSSSEQQF